MLLFKNCEKIRYLFNKINEDIVNRPYYNSFHDQPYIVYNAFKYNLYNNSVLKYILSSNSNKRIKNIKSLQRKLKTINSIIQNSKNKYYENLKITISSNHNLFIILVLAKG